MDHPTRPAPVSLHTALRFWLQLGFISFGGPAGQIALMHSELVERRRWISERRFLHALNYCMVLPGPEAQQLATYLGWLMHRTVGGIAAGVLFVLPSLVLMIVLSWVYLAFGDVPVVAGLFYGIKPAVTAIVVQAAHRIGSRALKNRVMWAIAAAAFVAIFALNVPFPAIVAAAALIGHVGGRLSPDTFRLGGGHGKAAPSFGPALIDDAPPNPEHARFRWPRLAQGVGLGALLWAVPMALRAALRGWTHTPTTVGGCAVSGAVNFRSPWVESTSGPPARMKMNDGRDVNHVTSIAASAPLRNSASGPAIALAWPPRKPTKATTMISGPGVVSPSARPSIICVAVSQPCVPTAPW